MQKKKGNNPQIHLLIIDPSNDFMADSEGNPYSVRITSKYSSPAIETADLPVMGAIEDMTRVAELIYRYIARITKITVTLCSHALIDVGHAPMWKDRNGKSPAKFAQIFYEHILDRVWTPRDPRLRKRMLDYALKLKDTKYQAITIWSERGHCITGTWGQNIYPVLDAALQRWSIQNSTPVEYLLKGRNPWREHYGALMAEVRDPRDSETGLNKKLIKTASKADRNIVVGEELTHCYSATVDQMYNTGKVQPEKIVLLTDCVSVLPAIPGVVDFPAMGKAWLENAADRRMVCTTSTEITL